MVTASGLRAKWSTLQQSNLARIGRNAVALMGSNIVHKGTTFVVYALVARHLGVEIFGQLSLALSLLYLFHIFAVAGVKTVALRAVANDRSQSNRYLVHGLLIVTIAALLSYGAVLLFVEAMGYPAATVRVIVLLFVALLPFALSQVCEAIFQAWEKMELIAHANVPVRLIQTLIIYQLLVGGANITAVVLTLAAAYWGVLLVEGWLIVRHWGWPRWQIEPTFVRTLLGTAVTFLGIEGVIAIKSSVDMVVLSKFTSAEEIGLFSAALQVTVPLALIINNGVHSVFPLLCRQYERGAQDLERVGRQLIALLFGLLLPIIVGIGLFANEILLLLYRDRAFLQATFLLQVVVWFALVNALTTVLGQLLWASRQEKRSFQIVLINSAIKLGTSLLFVSQWGLWGVLVAFVITSLISLLQHYWLARDLVPLRQLVRAIWPPLLAATAMLGLWLMLPAWGAWPRITAATAAYLLLLAALYFVFSANTAPWLRLGQAMRLQKE